VEGGNDTVDEVCDALQGDAERCAAFLDDYMSVGRIIVGEFVCMDKQGNIILQQVVERVEIDGMTEDKFLGQILDAQKQTVACEVEVLQREAAEVQALVAKGMEISQTTAHSR